MWLNQLTSLIPPKRFTSGPPGVLDGLHRLAHHAVICCHHQDDNVSGVSAAGSHGGEGGVTRRVQEGDLLAGGQLDCRGGRDGERGGVCGVSVVSTALLNGGVVRCVASVHPERRQCAA